MFRLQCITSLVQLLIPHYNILTLTILKSFGLTNRQTTQISCIKITAYRSFLVDWETERAMYDFIPRYPIISFSFLTRMLQQKDFSMSIRLDWKSGGAKRSGSNDESKYLILIYQWHLVINWVLVNGLYWNTSEVDWTCCFSVKIRWISFGHFWIFFISIVRCWKDDFFYLKVLHNICHALTKDLQLQTIPIICRLGRWFPQINFSLKIVFQSNCAVNPIIYYWMSQRQVKFKNEIFWNCFLT